MKNLQKLFLLLLLTLAFNLVSPLVLFAATSAPDPFKPTLNSDTGLFDGGHAPTPPGPTVTLDLTDPTFTHLSSASCDARFEGISYMICRAQEILNSIIPALMTLGLLYFIWGVVIYMIAGGEEAKTKGRDQIIYGLIGLAVIVGVWGLVNIVTRTFGLSSASPTLEPLAISGTSSTCSLGGEAKFQDLVCYIMRIINDSLIPLIFTLASVMFIWGVVQFFIIGANEESKRQQGKQFMIWGIIVLAVMLSIWGLVGILGGTFGIKTGVLPQVHPPGSTQ